MHYTVDSLWNINCNGGNDGAIDVSLTGGIGDYSYTWDLNGELFADNTTQDQEELVAGTYNLQVMDSINCILDTSFTLRQPNPIDITAQIPMDLSGDYAIFCADSSTGQISMLLQRRS